MQCCCWWLIIQNLAIWWGSIRWNCKILPQWTISHLTMNKLFIGVLSNLPELWTEFLKSEGMRRDKKEEKEFENHSVSAKKGLRVQLLSSRAIFVRLCEADLWPAGRTPDVRHFDLEEQLENLPNITSNCSDFPSQLFLFILFVFLYIGGNICMYIFT